MIAGLSIILFLLMSSCICKFLLNATAYSLFQLFGTEWKGHSVMQN